MSPPKRYCTLHATAQLDGELCLSCHPVPFRRYANLVLVSATQLRLSHTGEPMSGIFEVISEHLVDTPGEIALRRSELENRHKALCEIHY